MYLKKAFGYFKEFQAIFKWISRDFKKNFAHF